MGCCSIGNRRGICNIENLRAICNIWNLRRICNIENLRGICNIKNLRSICSIENLKGICNIENLWGVCSIGNLRDICNIENLRGVCNIEDLRSYRMPRRKYHYRTFKVIRQISQPWLFEEGLVVSVMEGVAHQALYHYRPTGSDKLHSIYIYIAVPMGFLSVLENIV